ncbi:LamG-like jellyroll fold domain-containing protein [Microbacterium sp. Root166]|uniref:LamG-like jellyroll fold domain-containing protein n=1 Tax=Microbacterium sp. Root166 TaxID=1736478 RepID=UPI000A47E319|nr:LamG-like jellyroll fold domain-containing protein [Microbacterium sp. Root166]
MWGRLKALRRPLAMLTTVGVVVAGLLVLGTAPATAAPAPVVQPPVTAVSADRLPTVQINGVVWSQVVVGNRVYAGGSFTAARPAGAAPGTNLTARNNLLAYDITTGNLISTFAPSLNGQVLGVAASPDGTRIYAVGDFVTANGFARRRVAAFDATTGALVASFNPSGVNSQARTVVATNDAVYVGGGFAGLQNGTLRNNLVAYRASDGTTLSWNPNADYTVWALAISADGNSVFAGGSFQNVGGQPSYGLAKVAGANTATPGALDRAWRDRATSSANGVRNAGPDAGISSLRVQNGFLYGTTWHFGPGGNLEGTFKTPVTTGEVEWVTDCHGDTYSSFMARGFVYVAGHSHYCGNMGGGFPQYNEWRFQHAMAWTDAVGGEILNDVHGYPNWHFRKPGPSLANWLPDMSIGSYTGQYQAGWSVAGNDEYVVYGGEFPAVNGVAQQGLVRFAVRSKAPGGEGPRFVGNATVPTLVATSTTSVRVSFPAGFDRDDRNLRYRVIRNGAFGSPRYDTTADSNWWTLPLMGFVDTGLSPGSTYEYQLQVTDPGGNQVIGATASITMPTSMAASGAYGTSVRSSGASIYWPLNETSGTRVVDRAASATSVPGIGVTDARSDAGVTWNQAGAIPGDSAAALGDNNFSRIYAGNCAALGGCNWGTRTAPDTFSSQVWIRTTSTRGGRILGFSDLQYREAGSGHRDRHLYMTNSGQLMFGVRAQDGSNRTITSPRSYNDNQWHQVTATMGPAGMVLYVDGAQVAGRTDTTQGEAYLGYWRVGGDSLDGWPSRPTTANFAGGVDEVAIYPTALSLGQIQAQYSASGRTPPPGGTNQLPVAAFTTATSNLTVSVDGTSSTDPDGSIAGYSWAFGGAGTGSTTGGTTSFTYTAAGTYTIVLTVTDNRGATDTESRQVTVAAGGTPTVIANDTFDRTVQGGWGAANTGGAWATTTAASNFAVAGGSGTVLMATGTGPSAYLNAVAATNVEMTSSFGFDKAGTGGGVYTSLVARRIGTSDYRLKVRVTATATTIFLVRTVNGVETTLAAQNATGVFAPGDVLNARFQAQGAGTTTLRAKVWESGTTEPATWQATATDTSAGLQAPGAVGIYSYLSGSATNGPVVLSVAVFTVVPLA